MRINIPGYTVIVIGMVMLIICIGMFVYGGSDAASQSARHSYYGTRQRVADDSGMQGIGAIGFIFSAFTCSYGIFQVDKPIKFDTKEWGF